MSVTCAATCVASADAKPIKINALLSLFPLVTRHFRASLQAARKTSPTAARLRAGRLDEFTDFLWRREDHGGAVALHAGADRDRFAGERPELARVCLEPQVELPDLLGLSVHCGDGVGVAALGDGGDLSLGGRLAQKENFAAHSRHSAPALLRLRSLAFGNRLQVRDHVLTVLRFLDPGKCHARAGEELFRFDEPRIERRLAPHYVGAFQRFRIARKSFGARRLLIPNLGEAGSGHVLPGRYRVAGCALPEYSRSARRIARAVSEPGE